MSKEKPIPPAPAVPVGQQVPDWFSTPDECTYDLNMYDSGGDHIQLMELTRPEFLELKRRLAEVRGLEWPEEVEIEAAIEDAALSGRL